MGGRLWIVAVVAAGLATLAPACGPPPDAEAGREAGPVGSAAPVPSTRPDANLAALGTGLDRAKTQDEARLTLDWAYADARHVAVGLRTRNLDGSDVVLQPLLADDTVGEEDELPPHTEIADASGQDFDSVGGGTLLGPDREEAYAAFGAPEGIEPGREHRFRLEVPLIEEYRMGSSLEPVAGPFVFDFEVPVRPAPTVKVNQRAEATGVAMTLRRVVASPVAPRAVVCFEPPDEEHRWTPRLEDHGSQPKVGGVPQKLGDGCWSLGLARAVEGRTSVTVDRLEGSPAPGTGTEVRPKTVRGPWTFGFEAPAP